MAERLPAKEERAHLLNGEQLVALGAHVRHHAAQRALRDGHGAPAAGVAPLEQQQRGAPVQVGAQHHKHCARGA